MEDLLTEEKLNDNESVPTASPNPANLPVLEEMMRAGLFVGRRSSRTHPKMRGFISGIRNKSSLIDLEETLKMLERAMEFIKTKAAGKEGNILLVGTAPVVKNSVEATAKRLDLPFVT